MEVNIDDEVLRFGSGGFGQEFALRPTDEAGTPELDAACLTAGIGLMSDPVHSDDGETVGDGMTALYELPGVALTGLFLGRVAALIADSGGIDEYVCSSECHQTGTLGIPLIPADLHAELSYRGLYGAETEVSGSEIELLVVGRVIGDVHLAMETCNSAVTLEHNSRIMIESWSTALEEAGDEDNSMFAGKVAKEGCRWAGYGFCEIEVVNGLHLAEIRGIVKLLQDNEFGTASRDVSDGVGDVGFVSVNVCRAGVLNEGSFHRTMVLSQKERRTGSWETTRAARCSS